MNRHSDLKWLWVVSALVLAIAGTIPLLWEDAYHRVGSDPTPTSVIELELPASPTIIVDGAAVSIPAVRLDPPTTPPEIFEGPPEFANDCEEMSWYRQNAGLPAIFDRLGKRESNCMNTERVHTFCCWGWWQLWVALHLRDTGLAEAYHRCGVWDRRDVDSDIPADKLRQACATKALYDSQGLTPWST